MVFMWVSKIVTWIKTKKTNKIGKFCWWWEADLFLGHWAGRCWVGLGHLAVPPSSQSHKLFYKALTCTVANTEHKMNLSTCPHCTILHLSGENLHLKYNFMWLCNTHLKPKCGHSFSESVKTLAADLYV